MPHAMEKENFIMKSKYPKILEPITIKRMTIKTVLP